MAFFIYRQGESLTRFQRSIQSAALVLGVAGFLAAPSFGQALTQAQLKARVEAGRLAQEKELAALAAHRLPPEDPAVDLEKSYADLLAILKAQPIKNRELREEVENYELERRIARANRVAIARARERLKPTPVNSSSPSPSSTPTIDAMKIANQCLESGTCHQAPLAPEDTPSPSASSLTPQPAPTSGSAPFASPVPAENPDTSPTSTLPTVKVTMEPSDDTTSPDAFKNNPNLQ